MTNGLDIVALMDAAKAKLEALDYFDDVTVLTENDGDIDKMVSQAIARLGLCVEIGDVVATDKRPNVPNPAWHPINFTAVVAERVVVNRAADSYKTAMAVANQVAEALKGSLEGTVDFTTTKYGYVATKSIRRVYREKGLLLYEVEFQIGE